MHLCSIGGEPLKIVLTKRQHLSITLNFGSKITLQTCIATCRCGSCQRLLGRNLSLKTNQLLQRERNGVRANEWGRTCIRRPKAAAARAVDAHSSATDRNHIHQMQRTLEGARTAAGESTDLVERVVTDVQGQQMMCTTAKHRIRTKSTVR